MTLITDGYCFKKVEQRMSSSLLKFPKQVNLV